MLSKPRKRLVLHPKVTGWERRHVTRAIHGIRNVIVAAVLLLAVWFVIGVAADKYPALMAQIGVIQFAYITVDLVVLGWVAALPLYYLNRLLQQSRAVGLPATGDTREQYDRLHNLIETRVDEFHRHHLQLSLYQTLIEVLRLEERIENANVRNEDPAELRNSVEAKWGELTTRINNNYIEDEPQA